MSTDLSTPPQRRQGIAGWLWKTWFPAAPGQGPGPVVSAGLRALSLLGAAVSARRVAQQRQAPRLPVPTIAVGNSLVGGAGKTPACIGILEGLRAQGVQAGLLSRGYKASPPLRASSPPRTCLPEEPSSPDWLGDEAHLIHVRLGVPVAVHPNRLQAGHALLERAPWLDALVLDDGLSQTSLSPSVRVLVLDERLRGNGLCLPSGPNRFSWPPPADASPDLVLLRGAPNPDALSALLAQLTLQPKVGVLPMKPEAWLHDGQVLPLDALRRALSAQQTPSVWAVAGIAEPLRFFQTLQALEVPVTQCIALDDHAPDPWSVLEATHKGGALPDFILTTEKDLAKFSSRPASQPFRGVWALRMSHPLQEDWLQALRSRLQSRHGL